MNDFELINYYQNNLTKEEQQILYIGLISYDPNVKKLSCESILTKTTNNLIETLTILYKMNIDITVKEGFYLAELIEFWSSFDIDDIIKIVKKDITYFYSPIMIGHKIKQNEAINIIDFSLKNINVDKKKFILGIISILRGKQNTNQKKYNLIKTTK